MAKKFVIDSMAVAHAAGNCDVIVGDIVGGVDSVRSYDGRQLFVVCADCVEEEM